MLTHFVAFRFNCTNSEDFDWIVKYISATGKYLNNDRNNPYAEMGIFIGNYMYKCIKTNGHYPVNEIYKLPINEWFDAYFNNIYKTLTTGETI